MHLPATFEDRHTDAAMRRTIPRFATIGGLVVLATLPLSAETAAGRVVLAGAAAVALLSAAVLRIRSLLERLPPLLLFVLLSFYCVLVGLAVAGTGDPASPYRLFYVLPTSFCAVFFVGPIRFAMALIAGAVHTAWGIAYFHTEAAGGVIHTVMLLILALFAAQVSDILREALRFNRSVHSVLEAASGDPLGPGVADMAVDAALALVPWEAAAVVFEGEDETRVLASRGLSEPFLRRYHWTRRTGPASVALSTVVRQGEPAFFTDIRTAYPRQHPLVDEGIVSMALLPVAYHGERIGVLAVGHRSTHELGARERDRLRQLADQLGLALGSAEAYRREIEVGQRLRELNSRKDGFLATVSHELRTPAATIKLVASTLSRAAGRLTEDQVADMHRTLQVRAEQLCELVDNLLDEALADAGQTRLALAAIRWNEALAGWVANMELATGRQVDLLVPAEPVEGIGDPVKLERVVANLIGNAAKFSEPVTPIIVALDTDRDGADLVLTVRDAGVGIPEEELGRIFERFHQVDASTTRRTGGFGIGLSLVRHFVDAHGGTVAVRSEVGKGTTFTIRLPRLAAPTDGAAAGIPPPGAAPVSGSPRPATSAG